MIPRILLCLLALPCFSLCRLSFAEDPFDVLKQEIVAYNLEAHRKSLLDGTYLGEEGPLCLMPEAAGELGLNVLQHPIYEDARNLQREAAAHLAEARRSLASRQPENHPDQHAQAAARSAAACNLKKSIAWNHLMTYRARLSVENDDRLNETAVFALFDKLLKESLAESGRNLRDSLAHFYNLCRGLENGNDPLTPENVRFVNAVFKAVKARSSSTQLEHLDLDLDRMPIEDEGPGREASRAKARETSPDFLETLFELAAADGSCADPLLFMALIRRESNFNPTAISYVGAAGLTQIMPATGESLGMERIFKPDYFEEATALLGRERRLRRQAVDILERIQSENDVAEARRARNLMQESIALKEKRTALLKRYQRDLLNQGTDDRLDPAQAITKGFAYFCGLLKTFDYDMSLALAAYNAGPHRVKQYEGIPPYSETVTFRNRVLSFYREYLRRFRESR